MLNVLGWLVELEPQQAALLEKICAGPLITVADLDTAGALEIPALPKRNATTPAQTPDLFDKHDAEPA